MSTVLPFRTQPRNADRDQEPAPLWREAVGRQLRSARIDREERLTDVADRAGVSPQYLSEVERGLKDPSSEVLAAVAGALEVSLPALTRRAADQLGAAGTTSGPVGLAA